LPASAKGPRPNNDAGKARLPLLSAPFGNGINELVVVLGTGADRLRVHLGAESCLERAGFGLAPDDWIEVTGSNTSADSVMATELTVARQTLRIRNADGTPVGPDYLQ